MAKIISELQMLRLKAEFISNKIIFQSKIQFYNSDNRSCAQTLGKDQCELLQCYFGFFVAEDSKTSLNNFLEKLFKEEGQETCEIVLLVNEDVQKYVQLSGIVTKNDKKCLINLIDITQQKRAMTAILESQRLGIIGEMTSSIAHDFNNSLQIISGNLELALLNMELPMISLGIYIIYTLLCTTPVKECNFCNVLMKRNSIILNIPVLIYG